MSFVTHVLSVVGITFSSLGMKEAAVLHVITRFFRDTTSHERQTTHTPDSPVLELKGGGNSTIDSLKLRLAKESFGRSGEKEPSQERSYSPIVGLRSRRTLSSKLAQKK